MTSKTKIDHYALARTIYRELREGLRKKKGVGSATVWRLCDQHDVAPLDIDLAVKCSMGHLRMDGGIVRAEAIPKGDAV